MAKRWPKPRKWPRTAFPHTSKASRSTESGFQTTTTPWSPRLILNMPKLPAVRPREVIRFLKHHGFVLHHASGSHFVYYHPNIKRRANHGSVMLVFPDLHCSGQTKIRPLKTCP